MSERCGSPFCHSICKVATNSCSLPKSFPQIQYWRAELSQRDRVCHNRILHKNAVIPWRSGYDYMNKDPIPIVGEWTISSGCPGTLGKTDVSCDPSVNHSRTSVLQFSLNFIILTCSKNIFFYQQYQVNCFLLQALIF